jgi:Cysteine-rich secretory protein family
MTQALAGLAQFGIQMNRRSFVLFGSLLMVAGCAAGTAPQLGADGLPALQVYRIDASNQDVIPFRLLDSINTLRSARQLQPLSFNAQLNAAAATHSRDMSVQNRPWHFGSDGSSPLTRVQRVGYTGRLVGELISETFQTELETLSAWMGQEDTRAVILDPTAREIGFAWFQEPNGKIWWTLVTGA